MTPSRLNFIFLAGLVSISIAGIVAVLSLTRWGAGLFDLDSFNYIASARNLAAGNGLQVPVGPSSLRPMVFFAPVFAAALAFFEFFSIDAIAAARWLNAVLFGVNLLLFAAIVYGYSRSRSLTLASSLLLLISANLLMAHAWVLSEPLLITFVLGSLLSFQLWQKTQRPIWTAGLCISIALGVLTKFVGLALVPAVGLLFLLSKIKPRQKLFYILATVLAGILPFGLWSLRNYLETSTFHGFSFSYVPLTFGNLVTAFHTFYTWVVPETWLFGHERLALILSLPLVLGILIYLSRKLRRGRSVPPVLAFSIAFSFVYIAIVVLAKVSFDHGIGFQDRMLIPLLPLVLLSIFYLVHTFFQEKEKWGRFLGATMLIYLGLASAVTSLNSLPEVYDRGLGWNSKEIVTSPAVARLHALAVDPANLFFNNEIYGMYFRTGQVGYRLRDFPPQGQPGNVYLVIFKVHLTQPHPLLSRYADELLLVIEDEILSIHHYPID